MNFMNSMLFSDIKSLATRQRVNTLATFTEDPGSVPKTHIIVSNYLHLQFWGIWCPPSLGLWWQKHTYGIHTYMNSKILIHIKQHIFTRLTMPGRLRYSRTCFPRVERRKNWIWHWRSLTYRAMYISRQAGDLQKLQTVCLCPQPTHSSADIPTFNGMVLQSRTLGRD